MNYAEDRLDRRARYQEGVVENSGDKNAPSTANTIAADLNLAHAALEEAGEALLQVLCATNSTLKDTESHAFDLSAPKIISILDQLRSGHELAGRALRDCGRCRHATYHYALAWMCRPTNHAGAGDYAQMTDLAGYSEVGILGLLYFRAGGQLDQTVPLRLALEAAAQQIRRTAVEGQTVADAGRTDANDAHCGCYHPKCGASMCHVVIPTDSQLLAALLSDLEKIVLDASSLPAPDENAIAIEKARRTIENSTTTAADILEGLSKAVQEEKRRRRRTPNNSPNNGTIDTSLPSTTEDMNTFLPPLNEVPTTLRFWEDLPSRLAHPDEDGATQRDFPPLLQILLLKLLYASPVGGPFLQLACEAVPHLALKMPLTSPLGQQMARDYKSHFAYYILIRAVVLGERVKKHRRGTAVPYHVPVWDIVQGQDQREVIAKVGVDPPALAELVSPPSISMRIQTLLEYLSTTTPMSPDHISPKCLPVTTPYPPLFVLGDSHCLSIAWQTIKISTDSTTNIEEPLLRTLVPYPATGMKAWHVREGTRFFTHYNLQSCLQRLPLTCKTVLLTAGEIDCREGIGGEKLSGYYTSCDGAVSNTVQEYVGAVAKLASKYEVQILLLPVAPYTYRNAKKGKAAGRDERRQRILLWNDLLREECASRKGEGVYLLDYEENLRSPDESSPVGFVLNKAYNADYTHLNSAFLPHLETAFARCVEDHGCKVELL